MVIKKPVLNSFGSISHFEYVEVPDDIEKPSKVIKNNKKVK